MRWHDTTRRLPRRGGTTAIELVIMFGGLSVGLLFLALSGVIVYRTLNQKPQIIAQNSQGSAPGSEPGVEPVRPTPAPSGTPVVGRPAANSVQPPQSPETSPQPPEPTTPPPATPETPPAGSPSVTPAATAGTRVLRTRIGDVDLTLGNATIAPDQPVECLGGSYERSSSSLITSEAGVCKLEFPCELKDNYYIEITLARLSGQDGSKPT